MEATPAERASGGTAADADRGAADGRRRERLLDGRAWDDFCDTLKAAGRIVVRETPDGDPPDRVEGFRYLTRMIMMASARAVERRTPGPHPRPIRLIPPPLRGGQGVQSPNQDHIVQPVDARYRYRVTGTLGSAYTHLSAWSPPIPADVGAFDVGLDAENHLAGFNPNMALTPHSFVLAELAAADAAVDFVLSADDPGDGGVWFPMTPLTRELMGRVVYEDRGAQSPPRLEIRCLDQHPRPATPEPDDMATRLAVAAADPGVANWIDPGGRDHGVMGLRFVQPATPPAVSSRLVPVEDLTAA